MKKIIIRSPGSYDKLEIIEAPDLTPIDDQVLIEVKAVGVNFADVCVRLGVYESAKEYVGWPITPGFEVSGIVKSIGPAVKKIKVGQEVVGLTRFDAYASQVCVSEKRVLTIPPGYDLISAAGFPAVFFTAYHALFQQVVLRKKAKVLIHSAAGGVGTALVQLCKAAGFYVVAIVGSTHKIEYLKKFNPDVIIDKSKQDLWSEVKAASSDGFDLVLDANGYTTLEKSYKSLRSTGKLIVYGSHDLLSKKGGHLNYLKAGIGLLKTPKFAPLEMITSNKGVIGFNVSFLFDDEELIVDCIDGLAKIFKENKIIPIPATYIPFNEVARAHQLIESGQSVGKIILTL